MKASLLPVLCCVETLEQNIGFVRFRYAHHFGVFRVVTDDLREGVFADFTLKFCEVIAECDAFDLFFDFAVDPSAQTPHMYHTTASLTLAGRNQRVRLGLLIA